MYYLYILECVGGTLYTGIAVDVEKRFEEHLAGTGAKYTRSHPPVRILYTEQHPNRSTAQKREMEIKQLTRTQKDALIQTYSKRPPA